MFRLGGGLKVAALTQEVKPQYYTSYCVWKLLRTCHRVIDLHRSWKKQKFSPVYNATIRPLVANISVCLKIVLHQKENSGKNAHLASLKASYKSCPGV